MSGVKVREDITTSSRKPTEWGSPMYRVSKGVRSTHGQDGAVVLDIRQGRMFSLNSMGSRMLALLSAGRTEQEIAAELSGECGVSMETVERDLAEFIHALAGRALLEKG